MNEPTDTTPDECIQIEFRGRPVLLEPGSHGWSAHVVERGYFPVSSTGYRSFTSSGSIDGPDRDSELEKVAVAFDTERVTRLRQAKAFLSTRFTLVEPKPAKLDDAGDISVGRFISVESAAQQALEHGLFAPENERMELWEAAYLLYDRILRDPVLRLFPNGAAWDAKTCARAKAKCAKIIEALTLLMNGQLTTPEGGWPLYGMKLYASLEGPGPRAMQVPARCLNVFPTPLPPSAKAALDHEVVEDMEDESDVMDDDDEPESGSVSDKAKAPSQLELFMA